MDYGHALEFGAFITPTAADPDAPVLLSQAAEASGLDLVTFQDHPYQPAFLDTWTLMTFVAARTERIRMGSAVTVLSSDDPVRVFERFATLQAIANGRAEVMLGRGSFIESFPLFGYDLSQYEQLFDEKLDLFARLLKDDVIDWQGSMRAPLKNARVFPRLEHGKLVTWIGVGGTPESVLRAARYDMPVMFAVIGGDPTRFRSLADLYSRARRELGRPELPVGLHSPGYVGATDEQARGDFFDDYKTMHERIGAERGWHREMTRAELDREVERGALFVGSPETVARKIARVAGGGRRPPGEF
jgi:alkanesulfonate monooxygenase SsuD/methylene tetrahydromethanopterin reductase-like flavin-dependent oxidoreductase (luciferase family)